MNRTADAAQKNKDKECGINGCDCHNKLKIGS